MKTVKSSTMLRLLTGIVAVFSVALEAAPDTGWTPYQKSLLADQMQVDKLKEQCERRMVSACREVYDAEVLLSELRGELEDYLASRRGTDSAEAANFPQRLQALNSEVERLGREIE